MPKIMDVSAKGGGKEIVGTWHVKVGETAAEGIEMFGDQAINSNANANAKITVRGAINRYLKAGKSHEEIQKILDGWKMGAALERVSDPKGAFKALWATMSDEERKEMMQDLKNAAKAAAAG